ncbi:hypothetical protein VAEU17_300043 [Vibrio aestuarianus]|nr:hypothetical protein VAEU17_300043 [Vibrio aestuarianus]
MGCNLRYAPSILPSFRQLDYLPPIYLIDASEHHKLTDIRKAVKIDVPMNMLCKHRNHSI